MNKDGVNGDRGWVCVEEEVPSDNRIVLLGYWGDSSPTAFSACLGRSDNSLWLMHHFGENFLPSDNPPDVWLDIPKDYKRRSVKE